MACGPHRTGSDTLSAPGRSLESAADIAAILGGSHRIAVIGIKPENLASQPAHYVPAYLQRAGFEVIPVPVYYPEVRQILGQSVHHSLATINGTVDIAVLFRRTHDLAAHLPDLIATRPRVVWFQSGIRNEAVAQQLMDHGMDVVQDRCMMVEHRERLARLH